MTSDPMNEAWHEASYYSRRDPQLAFRTGWLAAIERAAEECSQVEAGTARQQEEEDMYLGAGVASQCLRAVRSLAPEAGDPATGG